MGSLKDIMEQKGAVKQDKPEMANQMKIRMIHYSKLLVNPENIRQASPEEIEALADSIELTGKIIHNLDVVQIEPDSYTITAGNKRRLAVQYLVEQRGLEKYAFLPCVVETQDEVKSRLFMILSNFMQKDASSFEKMQEITELNQLLPAALGDTKLAGRALRKLIAQKTGMSETRIANLNSIDRNLVPEGKEKFRSGEMNVSTATELAGLPEEKQRELINREELTVSDVKEAKADLRPLPQTRRHIRKYARWEDVSREDGLWCMNAIRDLFENTRLKQYKSFMFYLLGSADPEDKFADLAKEVSEKLLYHRDRRDEYTTKNGIFYTARDVDLIGGEGMKKEIILTPALFLEIFNEEYVNDIFTFMEKDSVSDSDTGYQIQIDDYGGDESVAEMSTEHRLDARIRDKCQYMDKLTCTMSNDIELLKVDDPERYQKCCGCCMACADSDECGYACSRKDMDIVRQRAGMGNETEHVDRATGKRIAQMELSDDAMDNYRIMVIREMLGGDSEKKYRIYRAIVGSQNMFGENMRTTCGMLEEVFEDCSVELDTREMMSKHVSAAFKDSELRIRVTRETDDVCYIWEDTMIPAMIAALLLFSLNEGVLFGAELMEYFQFRYGGLPDHRDFFFPSEINELLENAPQWPVWIDLPQIGQKYRRRDLDEKTIIVFHEEGMLRFEGEEPNPAYEWFLITPESDYWQNKDTFWMHMAAKNEIVDYLEKYRVPSAVSADGEGQGGEYDEEESSGAAGETAESIL